MAQEPGTVDGTEIRVTYHCIMTLSWNQYGRPAQVTHAGTYTSIPGDTEESAYLAIHQVTRELYGITGNVTVLFYRLTRNTPLA